MRIKFHYIILLFLFPMMQLLAQPSVADKEEVDEQLEKVHEISSVSIDSAVALLDTLIGNYVLQDNLYGEARAKSLKSWLVTLQAQYEESLRLGHEALKIQKSIKDSLGMALTLNRIGIANLQFERYPDAKKYITEALNYFETLSDTGYIAMALKNLSAVVYYQGEWQEAISYYIRTAELGLAQKDYHSVGYTFYNISQVYFEKEELDSSRKYLDKSVKYFKRSPEGTIPPMVSLSMADLLEKQGNLSEAISYVNKALEKSEERGQSELVLSGKRQLSRLYFKQGWFEKAYNTELEYRKLKESVDSANNASEVAEIEERYKNVEKEAEIASLHAKNLETENRAQRSNMLALYSIMGALILISVVLFIFFRRRHQQKVSESQLRTRIAEVKLIALRAQMNPHFIFNCINTAQNFVITSDKKAAYEYLSKFARLLRMVLQNSDKTFIPLQDEVEQLQLYMELEKVRFDNKFDYCIDLDEELQDGIYEVPGMIIQPLVENAILHGLVNKDGEKGLLKLSLCLNSDSIICIVEDNGVGRERAGEIKARKKAHYQSAALPNVRERLNTLGNNDAEVHLQITDLYEDEQPAGTQVKIHLPYR